MRTRDCASRFWFVLDIVDLLAGIRSPLSNGNCAIGFANDAHTRCRCLHIIREVRYFASRLTNNREYTPLPVANVAEPTKAPDETDDRVEGLKVNALDMQAKRSSTSGMLQSRTSSMIGSCVYP